MVPVHGVNGQHKYSINKCFIFFIIKIKNCDRCQRTASEKNNYDVLHPVKVPSRAWYLLGMDLIAAPKASSKGNNYILTVTDYFTKYVEAVPLQDKSAISVARGLYSTFCRHGSPGHIISDQGREFVNQVYSSN